MPKDRIPQLEFTFEEEIWKAITAYEGWYEASCLGRVKRIMPGKGTRAGKILKPQLNKARGYFEVAIHFLGKHRTARIHQLVAASFIGPRPFKKEVNHK